VGTPDTIYFVRHAKAGERRVWDGDDVERPLSRTGWRQAEHLAERLRSKGVTHLVSSPYVRCVQTLEPLAEILGLEVVTDHRLHEGEPFEPVLDLLVEAPGGAVLCSHGDIIPDTIQALHRRGTELQTPPDWRKASTWVLRRKKGRVVKAKVWPPPRRGNGD
jgi:8-oxo-dGTP diphosphatase